MTVAARLKAVASSVREMAPGVELPYVALEHLESETGRFLPGFEPEIREASADVLFRVGDVLFGKLRPYLAKVVAPDFDGCASGEFIVLRPAPWLDSRFLYYLCLSRPFLDWANATSVGTRMPRTDWEQMSSFRFTIPSLDEQQTIAVFLDRETSRIDGIIRQRRELLRLLDRRRAALLANAALGRLPGFPEAVPTGNPSLPELPQRWSPARLRHVTSEVTVGVVVTPSVYYAEEGMPFIRGFNVRPGTVTDHDLARISAAGNASHPKSVLRSDDVLVVRTGQAGAAAVVPDWAVGGNCVDVLIVRCGPQLRPKFLELVLNSEPAGRQVETMAVGAIQSHFNVGALRNLVLPLPPVDDQDRVISAVGAGDASMVPLIDAANRQIRLLHERRRTTISEGVTGRIPAQQAQD